MHGAAAYAWTLERACSVFLVAQHIFEHDQEDVVVDVDDDVGGDGHVPHMSLYLLPQQAGIS